MEQVDQKKSLSQQLHDKASKISIGYDIEAHDKHYALLFLGPSLLILSVFVFYPMIKTVWMSFFLTNSLGKPTVFVGLQNYIDLFTSSAYLNSMKATFIYVLFVSILTIVLGLLLAQTASAKLKGIGFFRTAFSSTMGVSVSVAAIFWLFIFNPSVGLLNKIAEFLHLPVVNWLTQPGWAMFAIIVSTVWMNLGFTFLILFGALQSVPVTLYEAARIAGVSKRYQFFKIDSDDFANAVFCGNHYFDRCFQKFRTDRHDDGRRTEQHHESFGLSHLSRCVLERQLCSCKHGIGCFGNHHRHLYADSI